MSIRDTRRLLRRWGHWAGGGIIGFPQMSAFMRIQMGSRSSIDPRTDADILACDKAVASAELCHRKMLIRHYCTQGTSREKAGKVGLQRSRYYVLLSDSEWFVHTTLDGAGHNCYEPVSLSIAVR